MLATLQMRATLDPHFIDGETEAWSQQGPDSETPSPSEPGSCSPSCDGHAGEGQGCREKVTLIVLLLLACFFFTGLPR